jgi:hypothetical protein
MARPEFQSMPLPDPVGDGSGDPIIIERFGDKTVQVAGTFTATVNIEGTLDGTNWQLVDGGALTAPGVIEIFPTYKELRVTISGYGTGTPVVTFGGFDERAF